MLRGYHLMMQGVGVRREPGLIALFLEQAVEATGLVPISTYVDEERGFVIIAESHISVHLHEDTAWADIFSCRPFPWHRLLRIARSVFGGRWKGEPPMRRDGPDEG